MNNNAKIADENNDFLIKIELTGFDDENINIDKADVYHLSLKNKDIFNALIAVFSGKKTSNKDYDVKINNTSSKDHITIRKYLQQNCLILTKNSLFCDKNMSVKNNIKIVSQLYSGFDLSNASISSFILDNIENEIVNNLSATQQNLMFLSYVVCCPAIIWIIENNLIERLDEKEKAIFENAVKIRKKHGGAVLIISCGQ